MSTSPPRVSFVVPAFNVSPEILQESLQSVFGQTFQDYECIVVDESTDPALADHCRRQCSVDPRFRYVRPNSRLGLAGSLNFGISKARGEWIARFDSDDICLPKRLTMQLEFLERNPEVDVLGTGLALMDASGRVFATRSYPIGHSSIARRMQFTCTVAHPSVIFRRSVVVAAGGYDESFRYAEDLELWLRLLNRGARFANLSESLVCYRQIEAIRNSVHGKFNLRARSKNFSSRYFFERIFGFAGLVVWNLLPSVVQVSGIRAILQRKVR